MTSTLPEQLPSGLPHQAGAEAPHVNDPRRWLALAVIAIAQLMVVLDASIVNIALPSAAKDLHIGSLSSAQWVITAYTLAFGGLLLLGGRIADYNGRKKTFIIGLLGFAVASGIGGAATNSSMLFGARAVQGLFAALLAPAALSLISTHFTEPKERATAFGVYGAISGAGAAIGLILGGALTQYASWRWCLYVNIPIAVFAALAALRLITESAVTERHKYDLPGAALVGGGLVALVYATTQAAKDGVGWGSTEVVGLLVAVVVLLTGFVVWERRTTHPLLPLRVPLQRNRGGSFLAMLFVGGGMFALFLFLTYYFQQNLGYSALKSGFAFLPFSLGVIVSAAVVSQVLPRIGPKPLTVAGLVLAPIGLASFALVGQHTSWVTHVLPGELVMSIGLAMVFVPLSSTALHGVGEQDAGVASALLNTTQQIGGALGTAVLSTIFASSWHSWMTARHLAPLQTPGGTQPTPLAALHGYHVVFLIGATLFVAGLVTVVVLINARKDEPAEQDLVTA
jgi:EmrB/QacA subfamily drug resistance transporter